MLIMVVDDEQHALENSVAKISSVLGEGTKIEAFQNPLTAFEYVKENLVDIAFLDIEMFAMNGIELAVKIREASPQTAIIFVTGYSEYAIEAFKIHANGYVLKPPSEEDIRLEIDNIKSLPKPKSSSRMRVQTFGNFDVFVDEKPLKFKRSKTKELFAYLIDRKGASTTMAEIISVIWEDKTNNRTTRSMIHNLLSDLHQTLRDVGMTEVIDKSRNSIAVVPKYIECDYYRLLEGDPASVNSYTGEYMSNYSWAELTTGYITSTLVKDTY